MTTFSKKGKSNLFLGPFLPKFRQKWIFHKNQAPSIFSIYGPLTSSKKSEQTNE